jgi:outer membrane protein assembly factor BamD
MYININMQKRMRTFKHKILLFSYITALVFGLQACGEYQAILKSKDPELKYQHALTYFNDQQYIKAQTLLDEVTAYYRGTDRSQDVLIYLSRSYMGQKDYTTAAEYYQAYIQNYPKGRYIIEARFQAGHCYFLNAPDSRLDQAETKRAIELFTQFVELYPESPYAEQAYDEMNALYDRLAYKEYLSAKTYYNLGTYLGNNYLSAEIIAKNALEKYPTNKYQEELNWLILQAKYQQVINSFDNRREERARETEDEYYSFITQYPYSKHIPTAEKIGKELKKILTKYNK